MILNSPYISGSLTVTNLSGSGVRYLMTSASGLIVSQTPDAAIKTTYTASSTAGQTVFPVTNGYSTGLVDVYLNGTKLASSDYSDADGVNITLVTGSDAGDLLEFVKYSPALGVTNNALRQLTTFTSSEGQTVYSASYTPGLLDVYYNGSRLTPAEYTANNGTYITLATGSSAGDVVDMLVYSYQVGAFSGVGGTGVANQVAYWSTTSGLTGSNALTINGSNAIITGSLLGTSSTASFASTASSADNFLTRGTLTAQTLVVQTITSSVDYVTGSTRFGSLSSNTHVFTGSMYVTGALYVPTGSVGIGTINPPTKLHVAGYGSVNTGFYSSTGIPSLGFANSSSVTLFTNGDTNYGTLFGILNTGNGWIQQQRVDGTGTAYNLLLQPNGGNVGIGTTNPNNTTTNRTVLDINGTSTSLLNLSINGSRLGYMYHNGTDLLIANESGNGSIGFYTSPSGAERMRITSSGSVVFSSINTNAAITRNALYYYENISLVDDHAAIVLLLGTYNYVTYKIDAVVSNGDTMETTATFLVDIKESTVQSTILGGFNTSNLAIISEASPVGTDTKFNFILRGQSGNSYLAIRNRMGGDRRAYIKIECLSTR